MPITTKLFAVGAVIVIAISLLLFSLHQVRQNAIVKTQLKQATTDVISANKSLKVRSDISDKTEDIVTDAVIRTQELTIKASKLRDKIDETKKGVDNGSIDTALADAAYIDSMWDAYCQAKPSSARCTSRQSDAGLPRK